jgi:predicted Zn-dependent peptidase
MKLGCYSNKSAIFLFILLISATSVFAQKTGPRQEKLLNGLKVLMWNVPKSDKVTVKIRVHSGSAFDPQQKEGVMRLLADNIFPNESAKEFFTEELGGSLEVVCNYDYIQINASAKSEHLLDVLQTLANAVANPVIDKETTARLRAALAAKVKELDKDPAYLADMAAASRLYGTFPYGRRQMGTAESVQRIDFADLIAVKERFLTADNATVTLTGNYNSDIAYRAIRRYFGAWLKSDKKVPSTFRQPDDPDTKPFTIAGPAFGAVEVRYVLRGLAKSDKDFAASEILTRIARARWEEGKPGANGFTARQESHILPGHILFGMTLISQTLDGKIDSRLPDPKIPASLIPQNISEAEFARAKADVIAEITARDLQERWLDVDTFKGLPVDNDTAAYQDATLADIRQVAERLAKNPVVTVIFTSPAEPSIAAD